MIPPAGLMLQGRSLGQTTLRQYGQPHNPLLLDDWRQTLAQASRLARAKAGNADAFGELFISHERAVFGFIVAHGADRTAAQEIAQDTWEKIWEQMHNRVRDGFLCSPWHHEQPTHMSSRTFPWQGGGLEQDQHARDE